MQNWAEHEMRGAIVPHNRSLRNLALNCNRLVENLGVSFSASTGHGGRQAAYRLFSNLKTTLSGLMQGHRDRTCSRSCGHELVLVAQDTTTIDLTSHQAMVGLGPISQSDSVLGLHAHSAFVMTPEAMPLGIAHLDIWARKAEEKGSAADRRKKPIEEKESKKWLDGLRGIEDTLGLHLSLGRHILVIQDREADIYDFVAAPRHAGTDLLIRAAHPRLVEVAGRSGRIDLFQAVAEAPVIGDYVIHVPRKGKSPGRDAVVEIRVQVLKMIAPVHGAQRAVTQPQTISVVQVSERTQENRNDAISWTLLTTLPIDDADAAKQLVEYYTRRWMIERLHFTLKSGLRIERLQFDNIHSMRNALAVYWIVAWRIMQLTYAAREEPFYHPGYLFESDELSALEVIEGKPVTTVQQAVIAVAKLSGYRPSPKAPPPGLKSLWIGLRKLDAMVEMWRLLKGAKKE